MWIWFALLLTIVAIVGVVFEQRARRSGLGWSSVARDFLAVIGAIALVVLAVVIVIAIVVGRPGYY